MNPELADLVATRHAIARRNHPHLAAAIAHELRVGRLTALLPGTYCADPTFLARATAIQLWDPNAVLNSGTAARLTWWPELRWDRATAVVPRKSTRLVRGIELVRGRVDPDLVIQHNGFNLVHPAWSVLELTDDLGGRAIDQSLRTRATSLAALRWALGRMSNRGGNVQRRRLLLDSKDEPWSENERNAHAMLRSAGIKGWTGNLRIVLSNGSVRFLDIAFKERMLGVEIDSWEYHSSHESFIDDRRKDVELICDGWTIIRFTPETLVDLVPTLKVLL